MTTLRVAIVGAGPAGFYAASRLLDHGAEVHMFDRLPTPYGLVRAGVAPDHPETKHVTTLFQRTSARAGFHYHLNVEIGTHLTHDELTAHHDAVIYSFGAHTDRRLGIPGEDLPGSHSATDFVGWYNGHPDHATRSFDLSHRRAVVIGNGNVALDVARVLTLGATQLARTDIADHAISALRASLIDEVVVIGRRGPAQAAYTSPELLALGHLPHTDVVVDPEEAALDDHTSAYLRSSAAPFSARLKTQIVREYAALRPAVAHRRIVLRFLASPIEILGTDRVDGVRIARNELVPGPDGSMTARMSEITETIEAGLVLRSVGYRGKPISGVPFDENHAIIPNVRGRVLEAQSGRPIPGVYTAGWIKRGPSGVIGTNKKCASETVDALLADHAAGRLSEPSGSRDAFMRLVSERQPDSVHYGGWRAIDAHERRLGAAQDRPRVKLTRVDDMLAVPTRLGTRSGIE